MRISTRRILAPALAMATLASPVTAKAAYWSLFNIEGESSLSAQYVTYGSRADMLADTNRTGKFTPNPPGFGVNIVGSGSDEFSRPPVIVPEPSTLALLGLAAMGFGIRRRAGRPRGACTSV